MLDLARSPWPDVEAAIARGAMAVVAVGAVEQHGAHLPLSTDTILAAGVARRLAEGVGGLLLPPVAYGDAWNNEAFAGTLSLGPDTLRAVLVDLGRGLKRMGVEALLVVNGHFGNREPIALAARALKDTLGFPVLHMDYPRLDALAAELCVSKPAGPGFFHADEVETSMMLALAPEAVDMARAAPFYPRFPETFGCEPMQLRDFAPTGVFGDPRPATAEKGLALVERIAAECLRLAEAFRERHGLR